MKGACTMDLPTHVHAKRMQHLFILRNGSSCNSSIEKDKPTYTMVVLHALSSMRLWWYSLFVVILPAQKYLNPNALRITQQ